MDLIHHYNSSSNDESDDDDDDSSDIPPHEHISSTIPTSDHQNVSHHRGMKRKRSNCNHDMNNHHQEDSNNNAIPSYEYNHNEKDVSDGNDHENHKIQTTKTPLPVITLLSSPTELHLYPNHAFHRNQPHITGNWAGNIYITLGELSFYEYNRWKEFATSKIRLFHQHMMKKVNECQDLMNVDQIVIVPCFDLNKVNTNDDDDDSSNSSSSSIDSDRSNVDNEDHNMGVFHISLSKPFFLQQQSIQPFLNELKKRLSIHSHQYQNQPLVIQFDTNSNELEILVNENQTRSFLTIPVSLCDSNGKKGNDKNNGVQNTDQRLKDLISITDSMMIKYGLDCYYEKPKFHCSIASWKGKYDWITSSSCGSKASPTKGENENTIVKLDAIETNITGKDCTTKLNSNDNNDGGGRKANRPPLTFIIRGIHCDFGNSDKHFIEFSSSPILK